MLAQVGFELSDLLSSDLVLWCLHDLALVWSLGCLYIQMNGLLCDRIKNLSSLHTSLMMQDIQVL